MWGRGRRGLAGVAKDATVVNQVEGWLYGDVTMPLLTKELVDESTVMSISISIPHQEPTLDSRFKIQDSRFYPPSRSFITVQS